MSKKVTCINSILAIILKEARLEVGLDEAIMSSYLNMIPGSVDEIESGLVNINISTIYAAARVFGFSASSLMSCLDRYATYLHSNNWSIIDKGVMVTDDLLTMASTYYGSDRFKNILENRKLRGPIILSSFSPTMGKDAYVSDVFKYLTEMEELQPQPSVLEVGDIVKPSDERYPLVSGCGSYPAAVVIKTNPLVLVSEQSDMRWESSIQDREFTVIGKATAEQLAVCMRRLDE